MNYSTQAYNLYHFMNEKNILVAFTGHFDHSMASALLKLSRSKIDSSGAELGVNKKIYTILVESIENVSKHSSPEEKKTSMLLLTKSDTHYKIVTANPILNSKITELTKKLDLISNLDLSDLKKLYREQLVSERTDENSAGLGMIDIAIKSENKIKYDFKSLTDSSSLYIFQAEINITN